MSNINLKKKDVLEIGCFVGDLLFYLKKNFKCNVRGVEASNKACKFSKKFFNLKIENKIFIESDFFFINKKNYKKFDLIICDDVLSWIDRDAIIPTCINRLVFKRRWILIFKRFYSIKKFCIKKSPL